MKILGIKNCDKVKKTIKWCKDQGVNFDYHDFRSDGLSLETLTPLLKQHNFEKLVNKRSTTWRQLSEHQKNNLNVELLLDNPTLIKRPVVQIKGNYYLGFTPEKWLP